MCCTCSSLNDECLMLDANIPYFENSIQVNFIILQALEANFAESNCIEQTNEADDSYKSALKSNLDATYVGSSEHSSRNEQSCERHNLNDWEKIKIVKAKYAVDPENVLHVSNYGPGTTPDELLAVFEPVVKV